MSVCAVNYGSQIAVIVKNDAAVTDRKRCCSGVTCADINLEDLNGCTGQNPGFCASGTYICPDCSSCGTKIQANIYQEFFPDLDIPDDLYCLDCAAYATCADINLEDLNGCTGQNPGVCSSGTYICPDCASCGTKIQANIYQEFFPNLIIPDDLYCLDCSSNYATCADVNLEDLNGCTGQNPGFCASGTYVCPDCAGCGTKIQANIYQEFFPNLIIPDDLYCLDCGGIYATCADVNLVDLNACAGQNPGSCSAGTYVCPDCAGCGTKIQANIYQEFFPNLIIPDDLYCLDCGVYATCADVNLEDLNACTGQNPGVCSAGTYVCSDCASCGTKIQANIYQEFFPNLYIPADLYCLDCSSSYATCADVNLEDLNACTGQNPGSCSAGTYVCPDCAGCGTKIQANIYQEFFPNLIIPDDLYCLDCSSNYATCADVNLEDLNACTGQNPGSCSSGTYICPDCTNCGTKVQASIYQEFFPNLYIPDDLYCLDCGGTVATCADVNLVDLNACTGQNPGACSAGTYICPDCTNCGTKVQASIYQDQFPNLIIPNDLYCLDCQALDDTCECLQDTGYYTSQPNDGKTYVQYDLPAPMLKSSQCGGGATSTDLTCWAEDNSVYATCADVNLEDLNACTGQNPGSCSAGTYICPDCSSCGTKIQANIYQDQFPNLIIPDDLYCLDCGGTVATCADVNLEDLNACTGQNPGSCSSGTYICPDCSSCGTKVQASIYQDQFPNLIIPNDLYCLDNCSSNYATCADVNLEDLNACTIQTPGVCSAGKYICPDCTTCSTKIQANIYQDQFPNLIIPNDLYCLDCIPVDDTCECLQAAGHYTSQPNDGKTYTQTSVVVGASKSTNCGGGTTTTALTCWVLDDDQLPGDCSHWGYEANDLGGCSSVPITKGSTVQGAGGITYYMPNTTTCWDCNSIGTCADDGMYDISSAAPCNSPRTRTGSNGSTCYHCDAVCSDLGSDWYDYACSTCSVTTYYAGNAAGSSGYTFATQTDCYRDEGLCTCTSCVQQGGGSYYSCAGGDTCEYLSAWCGDFNYEESDISSGDYICYPIKVSTNACSSNGAWAPYGLDCWACDYSGISTNLIPFTGLSPFADVGENGEYVFVGTLDNFKKRDISFKKKRPANFANVGENGEYVFIGI